MSAGRLKVAAALVLTSPFLPMLFQGEEWGASTPFLYFCDHRDATLAQAVREGRRREFAAFVQKNGDFPDPQAPETFDRSKLAWEELLQPGHADLLDWHKRLIRLRRSQQSLSDGRMDGLSARCDEKDRWLALERGPWSIVCNLGPAPVTMRLREGIHQLLAASEVGIIPTPPTVTLPPDSIALFKLADEKPSHSAGKPL
jgi:maltooligosyltrehalose trehalohydrolase